MGKEMKMDMTDMLELWKEWGGSVRRNKSGSKQSDSKWAPENLSKRSSVSRRSNAPPPDGDSGSSSPMGRPDKGKKQQSLAEVNGLPFKKQASEAPGLLADMITGESMDMSVGELFFNTFMAEKMSASDCKQRHFITTLTRADNRPFFTSRLLIQDDCMTEAYVLVDSGASASFIDIDFAERNNIETFLMAIALQFKSFNGSSATSGRILSYTTGRRGR
ncbi:hypothetical protein PTTG_29480 [Puccinia triticina 1-1 BBBD Race 1]|uniref:Uncharacterized protein n=1 Tax=Puccinia triticina (isolate 1-1 / race 1 (BBBD)) TaxID=630390 RepID=A0A180G3Q4_PUCT1|nr:hypothetical protein PTTG_29480 [Puccinia triticina 1-1 BBBD Race 1]